MTSITDHTTPHSEDLGYFRHIKVAVDGNIQLYQFLTAMRRNGDYIRNDDDEPISHLLGMFQRFSTIKAQGVEPIVVFDGGYPDLKQDEVNERGQNTANAREKFVEARERGDTEAMEKWGPRSARITTKIQSETEALLDLLGIPYLNAPSEADPQVAYMAGENGECVYAATEDFDTMVHGAKRLARSFGKDGASIASRYSVQMDAELSYEELVWATIASGTDYNDSPYRVGWVRASNMAKDAETFDDLVQAAVDRDKDKDREPIDADLWYRVKDWFDDPNIVTEYPTEQDEPDTEGLSNYLLDVKGLPTTQVQNALEKL